VNVRKTDTSALQALEATLREAVFAAYKGDLRVAALQASAVRRDERGGVEHEYHGRDVLAALEKAQDMLRWALYGN